jgi:hypothetical protein
MVEQVQVLPHRPTVASRGTASCRRLAVIGQDAVMRLSVENTSAVPVERMYAAHLDRGVREEACRRSGALEYAVTITPMADGARIEIERTLPAKVPDFIRSFVGDTIRIRQVEQWTAADPDGVRRASLALTIPGKPASMQGQAVLRSVDAGCQETVTGDVRVSVPIVGRRIEPVIVEVITAGLELEQRVSTEWALSGA